MNNRKTSIPNILIVFVISLVAFFVFGVGFIFARGYYQPRHPIYCTTLQNFEYCNVLKREFFQKTIDNLDIHDWQCFIYEGHTNRPVYVVVLLGKLNKPADLPLSGKKETMSSRPSIFTSLKLVGENPNASEKLESVDDLFLSGAYIYRQCLILTEVGESPKYLLHDEQIQAFLEEIIRPKNNRQ